ncbi:hypothetical protein HU200_035610 [Digitaria exilis]|uniref:Uncharacterized protein n=1 Tax=Digitaria exilis TaxID=1010633 RepID=A0A835BF81_9POAL|nr:hypothetical protein HU200_035610 [Digitaria exilis]
MLLRAREPFGLSIFRDIIIMALWAIWMHHNSIVIERTFTEGMKMVISRSKPLVKESINIWLSSLL